MRIAWSQLRRARPTLVVTIALAGAIAVVAELMLPGRTRAAASPVPASAASAAPAAGDTTLQQQALLGFLTDVVNWYRRIAIEQQLVTDPAETLFVADDRQIANEVLDLGFQYARAQAGLLAAIAPPTTTPAAHPRAAGATSGAAAAEGAGGPDLGAMNVRLAQLQAQLAAAQTRVDELKKRAAAARGRQRAALDAQLVSAQEELELEQARVAGLKEILDFERSAQKSRVGNSLLAQIDELEHSIPRRTGQAAASAEALRTDHQVAAHGILELTGQLLELRNKDQALRSTI